MGAETPASCHIFPLGQRPEAMPVLARWLFEEWGYYHERDSVERRIAELSGRLDESRVPQTFVALASPEPGAEVLGTAALALDDMETRPELNPWLASVLVQPTARGRGVGSALVRAVMAKAAELGIERLYLFTENQAALYARLGWQAFERCTYCGHEVTLMAVDPRAAVGKSAAE